MTDLGPPSQSQGTWEVSGLSAGNSQISQEFTIVNILDMYTAYTCYNNLSAYCRESKDTSNTDAKILKTSGFFLGITLKNTHTHTYIYIYTISYITIYYNILQYMEVSRNGGTPKSF